MRAANFEQPVPVQGSAQLIERIDCGSFSPEFERDFGIRSGGQPDRRTGAKLLSGADRKISQSRDDAGPATFVLQYNDAAITFVLACEPYPSGAGCDHLRLCSRTNGDATA